MRKSHVNPPIPAAHEYRNIRFRVEIDAVKSANRESAAELLPQCQRVSHTAAAPCAGGRLNRAIHNDRLRAGCGNPFISRSIGDLSQRPAFPHRLNESSSENWSPLPPTGIVPKSRSSLPETGRQMKLYMVCVSKNDVAVISGTLACSQ